MNVYQSSLGISLEPIQGTIVFGGKSNAVGITFNLATNLHQTESLAEQYLDFIQKLYAEQSYIGEYFEQIHLGSVVSLVSKESTNLAQELVLLLNELLTKWIAADSLSIQLHSHSSVESVAQIKFLSFRDRASGITASDPTGINNAFALWSLAFPETSSFNQIKTLKTFMAINYEEINVDASSRYLSDYKIETIVRFGSTKFISEDAERQRLHILQLAERSDTTKYELLVCRERLLELLEKHSNSKAFAPTGSTITGRIVQSQTKQSVAGTRTITTVDVDLAGNIEPAVDWIHRSKVSPHLHNQELATSKSEAAGDDVTEFFASPNFAVAERKKVDSPDAKFWKEPTATPTIIDAWLFRIVVVLAAVGAYFLYRYIT